MRYVGRLLPQSSAYRVLFTDGQLESANVQLRAPNRTLAYRAPDLPRLDGSADLPTVRAELTAIAIEARKQPRSDVLLYFTGHGSPDRRTTYANNWFSLWGNGRFTVTELARFEALSRRHYHADHGAVLLGAFGNVLFQNGIKGRAHRTARGLVFAAVPERVAAGCTPAINEAEYKDFTRPYFAALTGQDRMGRPGDRRRRANEDGRRRSGRSVRLGSRGPRLDRHAGLHLGHVPAPLRRLRPTA